MDRGQLIATIVVAIIGFFGTAAASGFGFAQFMIKRRDEKEDNNIQSRIDEAVKAAEGRMQEKLEKGLIARGEEGRERFEINSEQIKQNAETAGKILRIQEEQTKKVDLMMDSLNALNLTTKACAEGVKSTLYDKIYIIAQKAIARKGITADEKANVSQLWDSYRELNGNGKGEAYANICLHDLEILSDEEAKRRDNK